MVDPKGIQNKGEKTTVEASAAKVRKLLGEAGGPIAEGMMTLKGEVESKVNEIRAYSVGAENAAKEAKSQAAKATEALEQAELRNDSLLNRLEKKTTQMKEQVESASLASSRAEAALVAVQSETREVNLAISELRSTDSEGAPVKGIRALQAISQKADAIEETVGKAVDSAISINVTSWKKVDGDSGISEEVTQTLHGSEAFQRTFELVDYAARAAGDALDKANKAAADVSGLKAGLDALGEAVADAFDTVDKKLKIMMKMLERGGVEVPQAAKDVMEDSSYIVGDKNE